MIYGHFEVSSTEKQAHLRIEKESIKPGQRTYIFCTTACSLAPIVYWYGVARVMIDMLPDIPLLEILDFYATNAWMSRGTRYAKMAKSGFRVTASPEFAT